MERRFLNGNERQRVQENLMIFEGLPLAVKFATIIFVQSHSLPSK
ncbi:MAG: hypothetical protein ACR2MD_06380 [Aridibacter sp.]|jgi:hypothetical protein